MLTLTECHLQQPSLSEHDATSITSQNGAARSAHWYDFAISAGSMLYQLQEAHKSLLMVKGQSKLCGKELVDTIKLSEEVSDTSGLGSALGAASLPQFTTSL